MTFACETPWPPPMVVRKESATCRVPSYVLSQSFSSVCSTAGGNTMILPRR